MNTQMRKGILEICVLHVLRRHDSYGYELVQMLSRYLKTSEGTIYPMMARMKREGLVETYNMSEDTQTRKYYRLTERGQNYYEESKADWNEFSAAVNRFFEEV